MPTILLDLQNENMHHYGYTVKTIKKLDSVNALSLLHILSIKNLISTTYTHIIDKNWINHVTKKST